MDSVFIVFPTNIDYLIDYVRLHVGDTSAKKYSNTLVRTSLISAVKMLQRRWSGRYLVYDNSMQVITLPDGVYYAPVASGITPTVTVPSGYMYAMLPDGYGIIPNTLTKNDVFRNPSVTFNDNGQATIHQYDEYPITVMAAIILQRSYMTSSAESFVSWSDGEFTVSSIQASRVLGDMLRQDMEALDLYFRKRLTDALTGEFQDT